MPSAVQMDKGGKGSKVTSGETLWYLQAYGIRCSIRDYTYKDTFLLLPMALRLQQILAVWSETGNTMRPVCDVRVTERKKADKVIMMMTVRCRLCSPEVDGARQ